MRGGRGALLVAASACACAALVAGASFAAAAGGGLSVVSKQAQAQNFAHASVSCGAGRHALSGGFSARPGTIGQRSAPTSSGGWQVRIYDATNPPSARPFTVSALCEPAGSRELRHISRNISFGAGKRRSAIVPCPTGWKVISGGYSILPPYNGGATGEIAVDRNARLSAGKWIVSASSDGISSTLVAYAVCERRSMPAVSEVRNKVSLDPSDPTTAVVTCKAGSHLLGGGFQSAPPENAGLFPAVSTSAPRGTRAWKTVFADFGMPTVPGSISSVAYCEPN